MGPLDTVAIVSVGNELLYGETVDTNAAWLGKELTGWGLRVVRGYTVGDRAPEIREAVTDAMRVADAVVVSGGLGPTSDDVTKPAVAELAGLRLIVDRTVEEAVRTRFERFGFAEVPESSRGQAEVPEGATALRNDHGTAPGLVIEHEGRSLVLLPGVPRELRGIVAGPLRDAWRERMAATARAHHRVIHTTGIEEPALAERVEPLRAGLPPEIRDAVDVAYLPDELGVDVRLTTADRNAERARERLSAAEEGLAAAFSPWHFEAESGDLVEAVSRLLKDEGLRLAAAESCTGGLLAARMTDRAGSSEVFVGGIVAYDDEVKIAQLHVFPPDLGREGAVSDAVVRQMASGVASQLGADVGVAITGVAGPGGGSDEKPVGTVWIAASFRAEVTAVCRRFAGDRGEVRRRSAQAALALVHDRLLGRPPAGPDGRSGAS